MYSKCCREKTCATMLQKGSQREVPSSAYGSWRDAILTHSLVHRESTRAKVCQDEVASRATEVSFLPCRAVLGSCFAIGIADRGNW